MTKHSERSQLIHKILEKIGVQDQGEMTWEQVQQFKLEALKQASRNTLDQQKHSAVNPVPIPFPNHVEVSGNLNAELHDQKRIVISGVVAPRHAHWDVRDTIRIDLPEPINMLEHADGHYSGLAMTIYTHASTSPEARWGVRLIGTNGRTSDILPTLPLKNRWDANPFEIYLDWAFINYDDVEDAIAVLHSVIALEFGVTSALRAPQRGPSHQDQPVHFELSDLRLVDYLKGSYDPDRHSWGWDGSDNKDMTLQHRVQEFTGVMARFGGEEALTSAMESLDLAVRTQCWDGSFLDCRRGANTVTSGEFTHGFTLWGLLNGYTHFEAIGLPQLDEVMTVGPDTMTRRDFYQRMFYRGAMSRSIALPSDYRDDIIGSNTLIYGANRVLGFGIAMRCIAEHLTDQDQRKQVLAAYEPYIQEVADAQGAFSGGFPLLGEGDIYRNRGIHYDCGYIRTHMDWLVIGIKATQDPALLRILDRYQAVIEAAMDQSGTGILPLISERTRSKHTVSLVLPDITSQLGKQLNLPIIAQWGYNVGMPTWAKLGTERRFNHFIGCMNGRGYGLATHTGILLSDLEPQPVPQDLSYRFPRQWPIWSSRFYQKDDGSHTRTSYITVHADGHMENDFQIQVGEFLETIGVPVTLEVSDGKVIAEAVAMQGWPALLDADTSAVVQTDRVTKNAGINQPIELLLERETRVIITGPQQELPSATGNKTMDFRAELLLKPCQPGQKITIRVLNEVFDYVHEYTAEK